MDKVASYKENTYYYTFFYMNTQPINRTHSGLKDIINPFFHTVQLRQTSCFTLKVLNATSLIQAVQVTR